MISNDHILISPLIADGKGLGFRIETSDGRHITDLLLSSQGNIRARSVEVKDRSIRLEDLEADPTPTFGSGSFVEVELDPDDPYPHVNFNLEIEAFDEEGWREEIGEAPFHFLVCSLPGAEIFHQRGWNIPTPVIDPYPLRGRQTGYGRQISSLWSRDWTYCPPIGAYPLATVGLWKPSQEKYVAYDFHGARLTDGSERYIASAYCWKQGEAEQFFSLVYPYAERYNKLRYPKPPLTISSHFTFLYSLELPSYSDPNLFVQEFIWERYRDLLPEVPRVNDLSWLPEPYRVKGYGPMGIRRLYHRLTKENARWFKPGALVFGGEGWDRSAVDYIFERGSERAISRLEEDLEFLAKRAKRMIVDGDECYFWQKPLEGEGIDMFGPGVETMHNIQGWQLALTYLDAYRNDPERFGRYLYLVDGALRWTKHILYTRNGYADVPAAQFCWGAAPATAFCLRYYYTFRDDPEREDLAHDAYKLARVMMYRYMPIWASDNDRMDELDSSFLMEPNSGISWLGSACSNEVWCVVYAMALTYVATGDPIIGHYLRGACERWHELFRDEYHESVADYDRSFTEMFGLFEGCNVGKGKRASFGGLWGLLEQIAYPVGEATVRVICGEKGALAFNRKGRHTDISEYRYYGDGNFSFKLMRYGKGGDEPFDLNVTFPMFDLRGRRVFVLKEGISQPEEFRLGEGFDEMPNRPDTLVIHGVGYGDTIAIGKLDLSVRPIRLRIERARMGRPKVKTPDGFVIHDLRPYLNRQLSFDWDDTKSWAGLEPGIRFLYGVPFDLVDPDFNGGRICLRDASLDLKISGSYLFALVGELEDDGKIILTGPGGEMEIDLRKGVPALRGWPPCMEWRLDLVEISLKGEFDRLEIRNGSLFALTEFVGPESRIEETLEALSEKGKLVAAELRSIERVLDLKPLFERYSGRIAVMPFPRNWNPYSNPIVRMIYKAGLMEHLALLTPQQFVDPEHFNAERFPFLLYLGGESYYRSVGREGDGDEALRRFLEAGGTMLVLPTGPFPFYYDQDGRHLNAASSFNLPVTGGWEKPPEGVKLTFHLNPDQEIVRSIPTEFPFPSEGDLRWRPMRGERARGKYTPILTLKDESGETYGDGAGMVEIDGARIFYVWHTLLTVPEIGGGTAADILRYALQTALPPLPRVICYHTHKPIRIDGALDEEAWRETPEIPLRYACINRTGEPEQRTSFKIRWDRENLYVAYIVEDDNPWATMRKRDEYLWEEEVVELFVDQDSDGVGYREFEVNPLNTQVDLDIQPDKSIQERLAWDAAGWESAVRRTEAGWVVEMAVPFSAFEGAPNLPPKAGDRWRANFYRIDRPEGPENPKEIRFSAWSFVRRSYHEPDRFGYLIFAGDPFDEDFSFYRGGGPPAEPWVVQAGEWKIENGTLLGANGGTDGWIPSGIYLPLDIGDYTVEIKFMVEGRGSDWRDGPWFGVRCSDGSGYYVEFTDRSAQLHKSVNGRSTDDSTVLAEAPYELRDGWQLLRVQLKGNRIEVDIQATKLFDFADEGRLDGVIKSGGLILAPRRWSRSSGDTIVRYASVKIYRHWER
jgi:hypothetical protein